MSKRDLLSIVAGVTLTGLGLSAATIALGQRPTATATETRTSTLVIDGQRDKTYANIKISTTSGPCVQMLNSSGIDLSNLQIGPCGTDNTGQDSQGILISNTQNWKVLDSYIHVERKASSCCDTHSGIVIRNSEDGLVQGNVIGFNETNIQIASGNGRSQRIKIIGNYLLNPRGPFPRGQNLQVYGENENLLNNEIEVADNYAITDIKLNPAFSTAQEDSLSFGYNENVKALRNYVIGGQSPSGAAITFDQGHVSGDMIDNLTHQFNAGTQFTSGTGTISGNKNLVTDGGPNGAGIIVGTLSFATSTCRGIVVQNNVSASTGGNGGKYTDEGCTDVTWANNTIDPSWGECSPGYGQTPPQSCTAYHQLYPFEEKFPAPPIPPKPYACTATSPYSNNTGKPSCAGGGGGGGTNPTPPAGNISVGSQVQTTANVTVVQGSVSSKTCQQNSGAAGQVIDGPLVNTWFVDFGAGCDGWVPAGQLGLAQAAATGFVAPPARTFSGSRQPLPAPPQGIPGGPHPPPQRVFNPRPAEAAPAAPPRAAPQRQFTPPRPQPEKKP